MRINQKEVDGIPVFLIKWEMILVSCELKDGLIVEMVDLPGRTKPIVFLSSLN